MATSLGSTSQTPSTISSKNTNDKKWGYIFAICATVCWSGTGIFIDAITTHYTITPLELSFWRTLLVVIGLGLFLLTGKNSKHFQSFYFGWREIPFYFFYGVIGVGVFNLAWSNSVAINKAAIATALLYCSPVFVVLGARWLFNERIRWFGVIAIILDLIGVFLVAGAYNLGVLTSNFSGLAYAIASGLTFAIYTLWGKQESKNSNRGKVAALFFAFGFALISLLLWGLLQEGTQLFQIDLDWFGWLLVALLAYGPTLGGYAFFSLAINHLEAGVVSIFTTLEPPIAAVFAWLILNRTLNWWQWLGALLIVAGVLILQSGGRFNFKKHQV